MTDAEQVIADADIDAIEAKWLQQCGPCDGGLPMGCSHPGEDYRPVMSRLVAEIRRLRAHPEAVRDLLPPVTDLLCCPFCGSEVSPRMEYVGPPYLAENTLTGFDCDNYRCNRSWDKHGRLDAATSEQPS